MVRDTAALAAHLGALHTLLVGLPPGPPLEGTAEAAQVGHRLADQIEDYLLPRLEHLDAPLLVGIGGSTGAGKSTITNSLIGDNVSISGILRPTTRTPVLVCHPDDRAWFMEGAVLPELARTTGRAPTDGSALVVHTSDRLTAGLAILDTPDIDSVEIANHQLAAQLLGATDLWLFVTTAARYADAVPWDYLRTAQERGTALAIAINRIPPNAGDQVTAHFAEMLAEQGLAGTPVFAIPEAELADARLPDNALAPLRGWLDHLAADAYRRSEMVQQTIDGAVESIPERVDRVAAAVDTQAAAVGALADIADARHEAAYQSVEHRLAEGTLLRQEVLAGWQEFVGTGEFMKSLQSGIARMRDRLRSVFTGSPTASAEVQGEVQSSVSLAIIEALDGAADSTVAAWEHSPGGPAVLGADARSLARVSPDLRTRAETEVTLWQDFVLGLVRQQAEGKRLAARSLSLGINSIGVALMVALFAQTGGITGGEVVVAGGTATLSQALLTAIFGENAVRDLARQASDDLLARIHGLIDTEAERFHDRLDGLPSAANAAALREAATQIVDVA